MNVSLKAAIPFLTVLMLTSCGGKNKYAGDTETTPGEESEMTAQTQPVERTAILKNDLLNAVYLQYVDLNSALVKGDETAAKLAAAAMEAGAKSMDGGHTIATSAAKVLTASDIESERAAFAAISIEMGILIRKHGLLQGELYLAHCPMAFDDKGASWISSSKEIRNPYFGDQMLACGVVQETIK